MNTTSKDLIFFPESEVYSINSKLLYCGYIVNISVHIYFSLSKFLDILAPSESLGGRKIGIHRTPIRAFIYFFEKCSDGLEPVVLPRARLRGASIFIHLG